MNLKQLDARVLSFGIFCLFLGKTFVYDKTIVDAAILGILLAYNAFLHWTLVHPKIRDLNAKLEANHKSYEQKLEELKIEQDTLRKYNEDMRGSLAGVKISLANRGSR